MPHASLFTTLVGRYPDPEEVYQPVKGCCSHHGTAASQGAGVFGRRGGDVRCHEEDRGTSVMQRQKKTIGGAAAKPDDSEARVVRVAERPPARRARQEPEEDARHRRAS